MTRSGIKQGLAVSAVGALAIVGLPAAAHAAGPSADAYQMNLTASSNSVVTGQATKYTLTVKNQNGGVATGDIVINVTEAAATPTEATNPLAIAADAPTVGSAAAADTTAALGTVGSATTWDSTLTVTLDANGQAVFDVSSTKAGAVTGCCRGQRGCSFSDAECRDGRVRQQCGDEPRGQRHQRGQLPRRRTDPEGQRHPSRQRRRCRRRRPDQR